MICRKCGTDIDVGSVLPDGTLRCPGCGAVYRRSAASRPQQTQAPQETASAQPVAPRQYTPPQPDTPAQPVYFARGPVLVQQQREKVKKIIKEKSKIPLWLVAIIGALLVIVIILIFSDGGGGNPYQKQYELIERYESAYNNQDFYAMTQCFEPSAIQFSNGLASAMGGNMSAYMQMVPLVSEVLGASGVMNEYFGKVDFIPYKCTVKGSEGVIAYHVEYVRDGKTEKFDQAAALKQVDGNWYMSAVQPSQDELFGQLK